MGPCSDAFPRVPPLISSKGSAPVLLDAFASSLASAFGCGEIPCLAASHAGALDQLRQMLRRAPASLLVWDPRGGVRQPSELATLLRRYDLPPAFVGWTPAGGRLLAVLERERVPLEPAPPGFRVVAIVPTFNEADVIEHTLGYLIQDRVEVYVLDSWSTDGTPDIARRLGDQLGGVLGVERFPPEAPPTSYDLRRIMTRVEELGQTLSDSADWVMLHDADERRRSPWPGVSLRDGLWYVQRRGFNCIDHVTLTFSPTDNRYDGRQDVEVVLRSFEFSDHPGHFHQRRAWRAGQPVSLAPTAGHDVQLAGRRVFPYRFLLKHYPIRSQAHGERKVFAERLPRWNAGERAHGWHAQYDEIARMAHPSFLRDPASLERFDERTFYERWLVQRLSGVGVFRQPPAWATPPLWTAA